MQLLRAVHRYAGDVAPSSRDNTTRCTSPQHHDTHLLCPVRGHGTSMQDTCYTFKPRRKAALLSACKNVIAKPFSFRQKQQLALLQHTVQAHGLGDTDLCVLRCLCMLLAAATPGAQTAATTDPTKRGSEPPPSRHTKQSRHQNRCCLGSSLCQNEDAAQLHGLRPEHPAAVAACHDAAGADAQQNSCGISPAGTPTRSHTRHRWSS